MPRLKWSPHALRDIARLYDFLSPKSRDAGRRAVRAIRQGLKLLGKNPEFGEWVIEFGSGAYVGLYRYDGKEVVILALRHGREAGYFGD